MSKRYIFRFSKTGGMRFYIPSDVQRLFRRVFSADLMFRWPFARIQSTPQDQHRPAAVPGGFESELNIWKSKQKSL